MPSYFFNPIHGSNANSGLSEALAKANIAGLGGSGLAAGDKVLFAYDCVHDISEPARTFSSGNTSNQLYFGAYVDSRVPFNGFRPIVGNAGGVGSFILNAATRKFWTVENIWFKATHPNTTSCIYAATQGTGLLPGAGPIVGMIWRNCRFSGASSVGFFGGRESNSENQQDGTIWENCSFFDNGGHGLFVQGENCRIRRNKFYNNGSIVTPSGSHGLSLQANISQYAFNNGWALVSGTIYSRTLTATERSSTSLYFSAAPYELRFDGVAGNAGLGMIRNDAAAAAPASGEYSVVGTTLYVNGGVAFTSGLCKFAFRPTRNNLIELNEAYDNIQLVTNAFGEGHGVALDDLSSSNIVRRNKIYKNQGAGVSINNGGSNSVTDNLITGNGKFGISASGRGNNIDNNTVAGNNTAAGALGYELHSTPAASGTIRNNLIVANPANAVRGVSADAGSTIANNAVRGFATNETPAGSGTITAPPMLSADFVPLPGSPLLRAGLHLGYRRDVDSKQRTKPPSIGAYDVSNLRRKPMVDPSL